MMKLEPGGPKARMSSWNKNKNILKYDDPREVALRATGSKIGGDSSGVYDRF